MFAVCQKVCRNVKLALSFCVPPWLWRTRPRATKHTLASGKARMFAKRLGPRGGPPGAAGVFSSTLRVRSMITSGCVLWPCGALAVFAQAGPHAGIEASADSLCSAWALATVSVPGTRVPRWRGLAVRQRRRARVLTYR